MNKYNEIIDIISKYDDTTYCHITWLYSQISSLKTLFDLSRINNKKINVDISRYYQIPQNESNKLKFERLEKVDNEYSIKSGNYNYVKADGIYYIRKHRFIEFDFLNKDNVVEDKNNNYHVLYRKYTEEFMDCNIINLANIDEFIIEEYKLFLINELGPSPSIKEWIECIKDHEASINELELQSNQLEILYNISHSKDIEYLKWLPV